MYMYTKLCTDNIELCMFGNYPTLYMYFMCAQEGTMYRYICKYSFFHWSLVHRMSVVISFSFHADSTFTVENVSSVIALLKPQQLEHMTDHPKYKAYMKEGDDQSTAYVQYYMHSSLDPSWEDLGQKLYNDEDTPLSALEKLRQFLPPIGIV